MSQTKPTTGSQATSSRSLPSSTAFLLSASSSATSKSLHNSNNNNQPSTIISLSKIRNYVPKDLGRVRTFLKTVDNRPKFQTPTESYPRLVRNSTGLPIDLQQSLRRGRPSARANLNSTALRSLIGPTNSQGTEVGRITQASSCIPTGHQHITEAAVVDSLNQVNFSVTQQESEQPQKEPQANSDRSTCTTSSNKNIEEVESCELHLQQEHHQQKDQQPRRSQAFSFAGREERKRKRTDVPSANNKPSVDLKSLEAKDRGPGWCNRNNMTPSSLLLIQNRNYIEKQQQIDQLQERQQHLTADQCKRSKILDTQATDIIDELELSRSLGQDDKQQAGDSHHATDTDASANVPTAALDQVHVVPTSSSASSSSLSSSSMLEVNNHFKHSDSIDSNSSINGNSCRESTSSANSLNEQQSNYSTDACADRVQSIAATTTTTATATTITTAATLQVNALNSNNISGLRHGYQQSLASSDVKASEAHYSAQSYRLPDYYRSNFSASMLGHPMRLDSAVDDERRINHVDGGNQTHSNINDHVNSLTAAQDYAGTTQQQSRSANINQYYSSHYNLIPAISSKSSSSPNSPHSSPSPKTNVMQAINANHNSNQLIATGLNNPSSSVMIASDSHLDHLSHHYSATNAAMNQHHQMNHHYSYNQQVVGPTNQHHLNMTTHGQTYAHAQAHQHQHQHQHQQHQQHQHQHQQHQHQQHQHQQQSHQLQSSLSNQQSIYHQIANSAAVSNGVNHAYGGASNGVHYHGHLQSGVGGNQSSNLMSEAHQSHLNTAAAACAAAAVVSQTLKTVANQHNHQHSNHYGAPIGSGLSANTGSLMNMTAQHHQQFHGVTPLSQHHLGMGSQHQHNQQPPNSHHIQQQQQQTSLPAHQAASIVTRKYQCKMCPQVFMSKAEMKYHNQNHMREAKPYKCLQCPKAFANSSYLSQHMRIHQGVKPYTCDICSRKFTQLSHLQQHKRTHTGDKPYKCNYMNCTKQFSQLSNLQSHSRCHQLDKPYKCNSCYKCFHDEQSLLEHIPRHLESKHLKKNLCIFCGSSYQQERGLVKHFQQYHTDKSPTLVAAAIAAGTTGNTNLIASLVSSTQSGVFATPSSGSSSSSSSTSSSSCSSGSTSSISSSLSNGSAGGLGSTMGHMNGHNSGLATSTTHGVTVPGGGYQIGGSFF